MSDAGAPPVLYAPRIVEALNRHEVDYVVIGAFAAQLHGAPIRKTEDIRAIRDERVQRPGARGGHIGHR